jgi:ribosomal protein S18 acetylase RimI-like enzyme
MSVRRATPDDRPAVVEVLSSALRDEPMVWWPLGAHGDGDVLRSLFDILTDAYLPLGAFWVSDDLAGVAAWLAPPDAQRFSEIEVPTRQRIRPLTDDAGSRYDIFWDWIGTGIPPEPCFFLDMLAVRPDAQGRGVGRALVDDGLRRAFAARAPAFLETATPGNVALYEHLGFRVVGMEEPPGGGPTVWFMRADPPAPA